MREEFLMENLSDPLNVHLISDKRDVDLRCSKGDHIDGSGWR